jgi:hypothetical protein
VKAFASAGESFLPISSDNGALALVITAFLIIQTLVVQKSPGSEGHEYAGSRIEKRGSRIAIVYPLSSTISMRLYQKPVIV